jgi:branched-chain amino acid transport system ATP-binding protein
MPEPTLLEISNIETYYGLSQVLFGLSLTIAPGEVVSLMGRNGMGKTTTVRSVMGLTPAAAGSIRFDGVEIRSLPAYRVAKLGIGPFGGSAGVSQSHHGKNLIATAPIGAAPPMHGCWTKYARCFLARRASPEHGQPALRRGQQMLAIGRALMTNPRLLILDEATEGLAPLIRAEIWQCLSRLKTAGQSILLIDKNVGPLMRIADRHYLLERGKVVWAGTSRELAAAPVLQQRYLGV